MKHQRARVSAYHFSATNPCRQSSETLYVNMGGARDTRSPSKASLAEYESEGLMIPGPPISKVAPPRKPNFAPSFAIAFRLLAPSA